MGACYGTPLFYGTGNMSTIIIGDICTNTCFGYGVQDNTPDYLALFGPAFGNLMGQQFTLEIGGTFDYALTINHHTVAFNVGDPHFAISFADPLLTSFTPGAFQFTATGFNPYGIATIETEYGCPVPGVPEPTTWALMILGFVLLAGFTKLRRRRYAPIQSC
jgi:PEP-CTERM motif